MIWFATGHALYGQVPNLTSKRLLAELTPWHVAVLPPPGHDPGQVYSATAYQCVLMCIKVLFYLESIFFSKHQKHNNATKSNSNK